MNREQQTATCELCGEPMPPGEEMFKFHGYSGPCPKPPKGDATPPATPEPPVRAFTVHICDDCLHLRGEMCHEPHCRFCRRTMREVADYLDALLIRPVIDGKSIIVDEGEPASQPPAASGDVERLTVTEDTSDGYHTFRELYAYRKAYNALLFNEWARAGVYDVHKSWRHSDGEPCFGGGWFIVVAQTPTGQISNHYKSEDWPLFQCREAERGAEWDGHTPQIALERLLALAASLAGDHPTPGGQ